ncbi:hypothetical protein [Pseudomonas sp. ENNP23]|uniref:hypothetical protein n=1 Tax=Pseudomonas sp. ENNP23 TaxID=1535636 RepID=UPI00084A5470|nr:hypothetical protein [Pseudomonas sp. ENNP23]OEC59304.1 hypothetical protein A9G05_12265 [Pseudomonas sp. ENNP23]
MHGPTFTSSIRLYGLFSDDLNDSANDLLVTHDDSGHSAIRAFVSRLDAEIVLNACGAQGYHARLLSQCFDPNAYLRAHQGWLRLHICYGFAAHQYNLLEMNEWFVPVGRLAQVHIGKWTAAHYLSWGQELTQLLQTCYEQAGLRNYNAQLNEWDDASASEIRWQANEALRAMPPRLSGHEPLSQIALFDAVECRWCFASTNNDARALRTQTPPQGTLS